MSLKVVELQIAIPKTFDAGKMSEQMQQQSAINQANAQAATERQIERNRETVIKSNNIEADAEQGSKQQTEQENEKREKKDQENKETKHPFKGNFVDFSG
ncbi:RNA polymerase subunit sigma [Psychrobacillus sp. Sa2BUA9]|uniref:RNA polymerase subunit sigma n=1 Tax=Psychrobacillus faecigallinarum TaxID=2762235 RepID=A0ABR8R4G5_9BACI|nr:RNA polymerase subunit sigma [Psychrobacillus faecigallinarum]MBD7942670.1 RNA polymerase subunit sigma [Psychrobacillus faecigallinarum]